jgi:hypothetical protein
LSSFFKKLITLLFLLTQAKVSFAQATYQSQYDEQENMSVSLADQTKSDLMFITAAGVGGAVLGLSTLSFASEPSKKTDNILTGAAVGIILGVIYVAYRQAFGPTTSYSAVELEDLQKQMPFVVEQDKDRFAFLYSHSF